MACKFLISNPLNNETYEDEHVKLSDVSGNIVLLCCDSHVPVSITISICVIRDHTLTF